MKKVLEKDQASALLFPICWLVYMLICITKTNYAASIAYVVREGIFSKSDSGIISASFYLTYGLSQFFGARLADRFSPYKVITFGLFGSVLTNLILCFTNQFWWVLIVWSLTGVIQFGVWPATARIVAGVLIPEHRQKASVFITLAIGVGGILSYIFVTPILEKFGWSGVFTVNVMLLVTAVVGWLFAEKKTAPLLLTAEITRVEEKKVEKEKPQVGFLPLCFASGLIFAAFLSFAQGMLDNGVKSWMPTMMMESYDISTAWASVQTAILYICNISGVFLFVKVFGRMKYTVLVETCYYFICLPACILMLFIGKIPLPAVLILLVVSTSVTYAMTNVMVRISAAFEPFGYSATVSGMLKSLTCFGLVTANAGYGFLAEHFGWNAVTTLWLIVCAVAICFGLIASVLWHRFWKKQGKRAGVIWVY